MAFVTAAPVSLAPVAGPVRLSCHHRGRPSLPHVRRPAVVAQADGGGSNGGGGGMVRVEYIIRPDGRVEELVTGVRGTDCVKLTEEVHAKLGTVVHTEVTQDYFQEDNTVRDVNVQHDGQHDGQHW
jgi:hypothetical protein